MRHLRIVVPGGGALAALVAAVLVLLWPSISAARLAGIEQGGGCASCHGVGNGTAPTVSVTVDPPTLTAGQTVTLTVSVTSGGIVAGGFYIPKPSAGTFTAMAGSKLWPDGGITHSAPMRAAGGKVTFQFQWTAPAQPTIGGVNMTVFALSANGDNTNRNDSPTDTYVSFAYGCGAGTKFYFDNDGDNYGTLDYGYQVTCVTPPRYAPQLGDCNDNDPKIHPGVAEICDGKDNNCAGGVDEGLGTAMLCEDKDGDGHGIMGGATHTGCTPDLKGFGACDGDCNDADPTIFPGASEACNDRDDNCDGKIDENARPICGMGWCKRYGEGCGLACIPGKPLVETCNFFDDDCDGVVDNGNDLVLCGENSACRMGRCIPVDPDAGAGSSGATGGTTGTSATSGSSTTTGDTAGTGSSGATTGGAGGSAQPPHDESVGCALARAPRSASPFAGFIAALVLACTRRRRAR